MEKTAEDYSNVREWLPRHIERVGLTVEQFAYRVGLSRAIIYFYMADRHRPTEQAMARICEALGGSS